MQRYRQTERRTPTAYHIPPQVNYLLEAFYNGVLYLTQTDRQQDRQTLVACCIPPQVNYFVEAFYNGVLYLAQALNRTLEEGQDPYDGLRVAQKLWNTTVTGTGFIGSLHSFSVEPIQVQATVFSVFSV